MEDENGEHESMFGHKVTKKTFKSEYELKEFRDSWKTFEGDLRPEKRILIDLYYNQKPYTPEINTAFVDIEVEVNREDGFPHPEQARFPINAITLYTSKDEKFRSYVLRSSRHKKNLNNFEDGDSVVMFFDTEEELLFRFCLDFGMLNVNLYGGWNSGGFDVPYIFNRVNNICGIEVLRKLSKVGIVDYNPDYEKFVIAGTDHICYLELYKKITKPIKGELASYKLDYVGEVELGENKVAFDGWLNDLYYDNPLKFIEYNIQDVRLLVKLDKKLKYYNVARMLCHYGNVPYDTVLMTTSPTEGAILSYLKKIGKVAPNKPESKSQEFPGAYVAEPTKGMFQYVIDLDFSGLYVAIGRSLNISPETKIKKYSTYEEAKANAGDNFVSPNGVIYDSSRRGVIAAIFDLWAEDREHFKNEMKKYKKLINESEGEDKLLYTEKAEDAETNQLAIKGLGNGSYGALTSKGFRFGDIDSAEAFTSTGQAGIKAGIVAIEELFKKLGLNESVLYTHTDSMMLSLESILKKMDMDLDDVEACKEAIFEYIMPLINKHMGKAMDKFAREYLNIKNAKHHFHLKQEFIARRAIFMAKANNILWIINKEGVDDDEKKVTGLTIKKSSYAPYYKKTITEGVINKILEGASEEELHKLINKAIDGVRGQPLHSISFPTGVKKVNIESSHAPTKAAGMHNKVIKELGMKNDSEILPGSKIKWVYLKKNNPFNHHTIAFTDDSSKELVAMIEQYVDYDMMIEKNIEKKLEPILEVCGFKMPDKVNDAFLDCFSF